MTDTPADPVLLSVVVLNYNGQELLDACLQSIYDNARFDGLEVLVVDNHSSDSSADMVRSKYPWARLIVTEKNLGFAGGNNRGAAEARGKYLAVLNNDTVIHKDAFRTMTDFMETCSPDTIAIGKVLLADGTPQAIAERFPSLFLEFLNFAFYKIKYIPLPFIPKRQIPTWESDCVQRVDWVSGCYLVTSRETYLKYGGLDESIFIFYEDCDLCKRLTEDGGSVYYFPGSVITHFHGMSAGKFEPFTYLRRDLNGCLVYFTKHRGKAATALFLAALVVSWAGLWCVFAAADRLTFGKWGKVSEKKDMLAFLIKAGLTRNRGE